MECVIFYNLVVAINKVVLSKTRYFFKRQAR